MKTRMPREVVMARLCGVGEVELSVSALFKQLHAEVSLFVCLHSSTFTYLQETL
jgi:hypothetical protein